MLVTGTGATIAKHNRYFVECSMSSAVIPNILLLKYHKMHVFWAITKSVMQPNEVNKVKTIIYKHIGQDI